MRVIGKSGLYALLLLMFFTTPFEGSAKGFGPDEWHEYRLKSDKNAVFNQEGVEPLKATTYQTADEVRATPVIVGNRLYVGNHNSGDLFAFNLQSGEQLWRSKAPNWIHSEMIYNDGTVFVGFGNRYFKKGGIRGTGESGVLALDADSGDIKWKFNTNGEVMPTPAFKDGYVYAATGDRNLYKIDAETGKLAEKVKLGHRASMSAPNIVGSDLYVGGSGPLPFAFTSVDLKKDEIKWQTIYEDVFAGLDDVPPAIDENIVVTTALEKGPLSYRDVYNKHGAIQVYKEMVKTLIGDQIGKKRKEYPEHMIYAMDKDTGEILWQDSLGTGEMVPNNKSGAPMIYKGNVYVGSPITKTFYAYDLKTGKRLWEYKNTVMKAPPVATDGVVYFSNAKGFVHALDAKSGEEIGQKHLGGTLAPSGPVIINDTLFVGSQDSNVYALPTEDIRKASDEYKEAPVQETGTAGYITFVYVLPIVALVLFVAVVIYAVRKLKRINSGMS